MDNEETLMENSKKLLFGIELLSYALVMSWAHHSLWVPGPIHSLWD